MDSFNLDMAIQAVNDSRLPVRTYRLIDAISWLQQELRDRGCSGLKTVRVQSVMDIEDLKAEICAWQKQTFGHLRPDSLRSTLKHMRKEIDELLEDPCDLEEYADLLILLFGCLGDINRSFSDLLRAVMFKMEKNKKRKWGKPDKDGIIEHVREG